MQYVETLNIDIGQRYIGKLKVKQNDSARVYNVYLKKNGITFDLTGLVTRVYALKPDGTVVYNSATITNATLGQLKITLTDQMLAAEGILALEIAILEGTDILTTIPINVEVVGSINSASAIVSQNDYAEVLDNIVQTYLASKISDGSIESTVLDADTVQTINVKNAAITPQKTNFITVSDSTQTVTYAIQAACSVMPTGIFNTGQGSAFNCLTFALTNNADYKIARSLNTRFRVALYSSEPVNGSQGVLILDDATLTSAEFNAGPYNYCAILYTSATEQPNMTITKLDNNKSYLLNEEIKLVEDVVINYKEKLSLVADSSLTYTGTWTSITNTLALFNTYKKSNTQGNSISYTFTGTGFNLIYFTDTTTGKVSISVDGKTEILDTSDTTSNIKIYSKSGLSGGTHTVKILIISGYFMFNYMTVIANTAELADTISKSEIDKIDTDYKAKQNIKASGIKTKLLYPNKSYILRSGQSTVIDYATMNLDTSRLGIMKFDFNSLSGYKIKRAVLKLINSNTTSVNCTGTGNTLKVGLLLKAIDDTVLYENITDTDINWLSESDPIYWLENWYSCSTIDITNILKQIVESGSTNYGLILKWTYVDGSSNVITNSIYVNSNDIKTRLFVEYYNSDEYARESISTKISNGITELINNMKNNKYDWSYTSPYTCLLMLYEKYGIDEALTTLKAYFDKYIASDGTNSSLTSIYQSGLSRILIRLYKITGDSKYLTTINNTLSYYTGANASNGLFLVSGGKITELSYFGLPFLVEYAEYANQSVYTDMAINQAINLYCYFINGQTDGVILTSGTTSYSKGWGRGFGWFITGLAKLLTFNSVKSHAQYNNLVIIFKSVCETILSYQQSSGLWRAIIQTDGSFEETSSTSLFITAFDIGLREGLLPSKFATAKYKAIDGLNNNMLTGTGIKNVFQFNGKSNHTLCTEPNISDIGWGLAMEALLNVWK